MDWLERSRLNQERAIVDATAEIKKWLKEKFLAGHTEPIRVNYSGYGDSGNDFEHDTEIPATIEDHIWALLPAGFVNNEGGQGTIILDPKTGGIHIDHEWNVTTVEEASFDF